MALDRDTHRYLHFDLAHTSSGVGEDFHYFDLAKLLSEVNRRSYRQGMVYHVANIVFDDAQGDAIINVGTAPNTWTMQAAWQLGFRNWLSQQQAAMKSLGHDELGTWSDFKVYLNNDHIGDPDKPPVIDMEGNSFGTGSWDYSNFVLPDDGGADPNDCQILAMGDWYGTYPDITKTSLLKQLELAMFEVQADPAFAESDAERSIYSLMSAQQPDTKVLHDVIEDIMAENELPPYTANDVMGSGGAGTGRPSNPWVVRTCMIKGGANTASPVAAVGGFAAPMGLVCIETKCDGDNTIGACIELVPGEYKGVHAYPMRGGGF